MGWTGDTLHTCDPHLTGEVELSWTCPRCDQRNTHKLDGAMLWAVLFHGEFLYCQNSSICGERQSYINVIDGSVTSKSTLSMPLKGHSCKIT